jgi:hypothetical protein
MSEEIECHSFLAIVTLSLVTHPISNGFKIQPDLCQYFSIILKGINKFLSVFSITSLILCFEELLEMNVVKPFFHSTFHSDF